MSLRGWCWSNSSTEPARSSEASRITKGRSERAGAGPRPRPRKEDGLNLELEIGRLAGNAFAEAYVAGDPRVAPYFSGSWLDEGAYAGMLAGLDRAFDAKARMKALRALHIPASVGAKRLDRWVEESGVVVTTGQQPGFLGGPLYSLYKGITAVRLARRLEESLGRPVLPVFWVASEDHDWDECDHAHLIDASNRLVRVRVPDPGHHHRAIHRVSLGREHEAIIGEISEIIPNTEFKPHYLELIRESYGPGATLADGFRAVLSALLGPLGMLVVDAANPTVKAASGELLLAELDRAAEHEAILREEAAAVEGDGFPLQVPILKGGVNLFLEGPAGRERLYRQRARFKLHRSGQVVTADEIRSRAGQDPLVLSPNVLLRPLVESRVLPVVSYVAGPGEIAYHGQIGRLYEAHGLRMPVLFPRHAVTVVESKIRRVIDKFGLGLDSLQRPAHALATEIARAGVPDDVKALLRRLRRSIGQGAEELLDLSAEIDATLRGPVTHARNQALRAFQDAERKIIRSVRRENATALGQLEKARTHLFPKGKPQERVLNPLYYLARYGNSFIEELTDGFEVDLNEGTG